MNRNVKLKLLIKAENQTFIFIRRYEMNRLNVYSQEKSLKMDVWNDRSPELEEKELWDLDLEISQYQPDDYDEDRFQLATFEEVVNWRDEIDNEV